MKKQPTNELLPCPFCGGIPEITKHSKYDVHALMHRCKVVGSIHFEWGAKKLHVDRWNTREEE